MVRLDVDSNKDVGTSANFYEVPRLVEFLRMVGGCLWRWLGALSKEFREIIHPYEEDATE